MVVTYEKIINNLSDNLMSFELESKSRKYNGYTLFSKHYHLLCKEDVVDVDFLCACMAQPLLLAYCDSEIDESLIKEDELRGTKESLSDKSRAILVM